MGVEISKKQPKIKDHERARNMKKFLVTLEGMSGTYEELVKGESIIEALESATMFYGEPLGIREVPFENWKRGEITD